MRLLPFLAAFPLFAIACASAPADEGASESNLTSASTLEVIKGREYARCWFDAAGSDATLSCTSTARGADPVGANVQVLAAGTPYGQPFQPGPTIGRKLDIDGGGTIVVGSFPRASFPVTIVLTAEISGESRKELGLSNFNGYKHGLQALTPEELPAARPAVIGQPFDLWPVGFLDLRAQPRPYGVIANAYQNPIAPYESTFGGATAFDLRPELFTDDDRGSKPRWFMAPRNGSLSFLVVDVPGVTSATITKPGYHVMTESGLRQATAEEAARLLGANGGEPPPAAAVDAGGAAAPVDADPTCGGDGQKYCANPSRCDAGTRWSQSSNRCVSCGNAGQTFCYSSPDNFTSQGGRCNDGTRWSQSSNACVACGNAGQTFCYSSPDNFTSQGGRCNDGTRWSQSSNACVPCGSENQTYCFSSPDNYTSQGERCNAGLRVSSSTRTCVK